MSIFVCSVKDTFKHEGEGDKEPLQQTVTFHSFRRERDNPWGKDTITQGFLEFMANLQFCSRALENGSSQVVLGNILSP